MAKKQCPLTNAEFLAKAKPVLATIAGTPVMVYVKEFSTGSVGLYANGKLVLDIDGTPVEFQMAVSLTAIGSKPVA